MLKLGGYLVRTGGTALLFILASCSHEAFPVAPISFEDGTTDIGAWTSSTNITSASSVRVLVGASWCSYTLKALKKQAVAKDIDFLVFYEDEIPLFIKRAARNNEIEDSEIQEYIEDYRSRDPYLVEAGDVAPLPLHYFMVKSGFSQDQVKGYPTILTCNSSGCRNEEQ